VVGNLVGKGPGRKLLAIGCALLVLLAAGAQINIYFAEYPTLGTLAGDDDEVSPVTGAVKRPLAVGEHPRSSTDGPARRRATARS
jgi:hypothetical protein